MCIIAAKAKGVDMPESRYIFNMFDNNDDGAGFMYAKDGMVRIEKGFMSYESFSERLKELSEEINMKETAMVMHFRITTHGGTKPENCHPFPITDSIGMLKKLKLSTKLGVAHNGIINITPRKDISDTMEYIAAQLAPLSKAVPKFYKNKYLMQMIGNATDSKLVFLTSNGALYTVGDFSMDKGVLYSNKSYSYANTFRHYTHGCYEYKDLYYLDEYNDEAYGYKAVMWLDETEGEFAINERGKLLSGDFAIDSDGRVYAYDYENDVLCRMANYRAYDVGGMSLKFDENSPLCTEEIIEIV